MPGIDASKLSTGPCFMLFNSPTCPTCLEIPTPCDRSVYMIPTQAEASGNGFAQETLLMTELGSKARIQNKQNEWHSHWDAPHDSCSPEQSAWS